MDNQDLIKKLKENDASAWAEIVNLYSDQLFAYALSLCSDRELSSDIVQHVFITIFEIQLIYFLYFFMAKEVKNIVDDKAKFVDWSERNDIKATLKPELIILLDENSYPPVTHDEAYKEVIEQAENFKKHA